MAWSIFSDGGGKGAAATWAQDELQLASKEWGVNVDTPGNEQFVYDWEVSEGGGGKYNPLNQGPVPGHPELTTTGSQYGGGAADFASIGAGLQGALDYLDMPAYAGVKGGLVQNNPAAARSALIASPWATSHYGGGRDFASAPLPGQASQIQGDPGATGQTSAGGPVNAQTTSILGNVLSWTGLGSELKTAGAYLLLVGAGLAMVVAGAYKTANPGRSITQSVSDGAKSAASLAPLAAA